MAALEPLVSRQGGRSSTALSRLWSCRRESRVYKLEESQLKHLRLAIVGAQKQRYKTDVERVTDAKTAVDKEADDVRPQLIALYKDICVTRLEGRDIFSSDRTLKFWQKATKKGADRAAVRRVRQRIQRKT